MTVSRTLVLGGSRGLGKALMDLIPDSLSVSRTSSDPIDFSKEESAALVIGRVKDFQPSEIIYVAGGGPHGAFFEKSMKSHKWAYNVNLFTPIQILYGLIDLGYKGEFVYVGSAIAERSNSAASLSYSTSKKSAKDIILLCSSNLLKTKVFSPPYMDTDLLPKGSWPREEHPDLVVEPSKVAKVMLEWVSGQNGDNDSRHFDWIERFDYSLPIRKDI